MWLVTDGRISLPDTLGIQSFRRLEAGLDWEQRSGRLTAYLTDRDESWYMRPHLALLGAIYNSHVEAKMVGGRRSAWVRGYIRVHGLPITVEVALPAVELFVASVPARRIAEVAENIYLTLISADINIDALKAVKSVGSTCLEVTTLGVERGEIILDGAIAGSVAILRGMVTSSLVKASGKSERAVSNAVSEGFQEVRDQAL
ncbi:hypothetical protein BDV25DRAFT_135895 [Aspergillus avenaceus]|uniref:Uncharacterized protein n=1 Tax=Aspergillus avenaceus TaxID=36643 RepID=A0A5N6U7D3_ASPAV|nr:hypothetical protein BDV25DRAFT_135895 [Aspergillus avenaceus]